MDRQACLAARANLELTGRLADVVRAVVQEVLLRKLVCPPDQRKWRACHGYTRTSNSNQPHTQLDLWSKTPTGRVQHRWLRGSRWAVMC
jgi:hypothetical protein